MITSTSNAQIKELAKLQKKSRLRDEKGIFLVEGPRMTEEIPAERIEKVYASESFAKKNKEFLEKLQAPVELLTDTVFAYVSDTKTPQGILAIVKRLNYTMNDLMQVKNQKAPHLVVLDNLQDPGNLGTIFRTAEAAGVTGILLSGRLQSKGDSFHDGGCIPYAVPLCGRSSGEDQRAAEEEY